jgi:hypothetical protein
MRRRVFDHVDPYLAPPERDEPQPHANCGCARLCGDDGDIDGPGVCKGLPYPPEPPLVEIVVVRRVASSETQNGTESP